MSPHLTKEQFSKYLIEQQGGGGGKGGEIYTLSWQKEKFPFGSLGELLEHFYSSPLPHATLRVVLKPTTISFGDLAYE